MAKLQYIKQTAPKGNNFLICSFSVISLFAPQTYDFTGLKTNFTSDPYIMKN